MLVEFRFQNHRSIRDEQAFTFAVAYPEAEDGRARAVAGHAERLLTAAALYGANASGKSNVLEALAFMQGAVLFSHRMWDPQGGVPRDPFAWGSHANAESTYEVTLVLNGTRYRYGFTVDEHRVLEEWLHAWPKNRQQTWYERDADAFKYGDHLKGENKLVEQVTRPNALFLSAAVQHRHEQLGPIYEWFRTTSVINVVRRRRGWMSHPSLEALIPRLQSGRQLSLLDAVHGSIDELESLMTLLRAADVGILDVKVVQDDESGLVRDSDVRKSRSRVFVRHQHSTEDAWLPLEQESQGTQTLLRLAPPLVQALRQGSLLAIDELEASLHPLLAAHIIRHFHDPATNPRGAQLLFTTHDTNLLGTSLGEPLLRRDQVWLTEKDRDGATSLYPLSDYKPRKAENIERGYLQGRYGAVPYLENLTTPLSEE